MSFIKLGYGKEKIYIYIYKEALHKSRDWDGCVGAFLYFLLFDYFLFVGSMLFVGERLLLGSFFLLRFLEWVSLHAWYRFGIASIYLTVTALFNFYNWALLYLHSHFAVVGGNFLCLFRRPNFCFVVCFLCICRCHCIGYVLFSLIVAMQDKWCYGFAWLSFVYLFGTDFYWFIWFVDLIYFLIWVDFVGLVWFNCVEFYLDQSVIHSQNSSDVI